jgi:hypothetical protein
MSTVNEQVVTVFDTKKSILLTRFGIQGKGICIKHHQITTGIAVNVKRLCMHPD